MNLEILQRFIDEQDALLKSLKSSDSSERERIFSRTIKLGEEYGELCDEVLASVGDQRKNKLEDAHDLDGEFADVIICTLLLAKSMHVNIPQALQKKIEKIKEKHNKQIN